MTQTASDPAKLKRRESPFSRVLTPFLTINLVSSLLFLLWPIAVPVFCAEFCLLAIWSAWGPGEFWKRFGSCVAVGGLLFISQLYVLIVIFSVSANIRVIWTMVEWLFAAWIIAQIPLWAMRYIWQWRITFSAEEDLERFSVNDNLVGITMIGIAFGVARWATDNLIAEFGPFGFDYAVRFYLLAILEIYLVVGLAAFGVYLSFRLHGIASKTIPVIVAGGGFAILTGYLWLPAPDSWLTAGIVWAGTIMFTWAIVLPANYFKSHGYRLYRGKTAIG